MKISHFALKASNILHCLVTYCSHVISSDKVLNMISSGHDNQPVQRNTRQKAIIASLLAQHNQFATAQTIHDLLIHQGEKIGIATVYRNLQKMAQNGQLDTLQVDGETMFRACDDMSHHHHLVCRQCGKTVEIELPSLEEWIANEASKHGFTQPQHTIEILGLCDTCTLQNLKTSSNSVTNE